MQRIITGMSSENIPFLESLDPRTKFCGLVLLAALALLTSSPIGLGLIVAVVVFGIALSPISVPKLFKGLRKILWFVVIITLIKAFTVSGTILFNVGEFYATREGVIEGTILSAKIAVLFVLSLVFVRVTPVAEMLDGIEAVLSPLLKKAGSLTLVLSLTLNFIPQLIRSAQHIKLAQIARGADVDTSVLKQIRFAATAAVPLFVSAFRSSHQLAEAMEARGYDAARQRTQWQSLRMTRRDWRVLAFLCLLILAVTLV